MTDNRWIAGDAPVAVVMISLNESHNMDALLRNLRGWAQEVFLVDSYSSDDTVDVALRHGVHVVQRRFRGFGDQWNFALRELPITAPWTMKIDPDERLTEPLKTSLLRMMREGAQDGICVRRQLAFMGQVLPIHQSVLRLWRTGRCRFTDVAVNEYPEVDGVLETASGIMEHHDSPSLDHWFTKQNRYSTAEAITQFESRPLSGEPRLFGTPIERRMWMKRNLQKIPGRYPLLFCYHALLVQVWRSGRVGWMWAHLRTEVYRMREYKWREMVLMQRVPPQIPSNQGVPDERVPQYD